MLFDRFVFVLYILFSYSWFLLGTVYDTPFRFVPILAMGFSLLSICIVTLFQLQTLVRRHRMRDSDRWSTVTWSVVHMILCGMFCLDGLEWTNVLIIFSIAGIFITIIIATVAMCSCYVIIQHSDNDGWCPHVHLTCICFWVLVQYMQLRLPSEELQYMTTIPVVLMAILRFVELLEECTVSSVVEMLLFLTAIVLHICQSISSPTVFFWGTTVSVCLMILFSQHQVALTLVIGLPFMLLPLGLYLCVQAIRGFAFQKTLRELMQTYDELTAVELVLSLDGSDDEDNWDDRL